MYTNNQGGGKLYSLTSGNLQSSRWGMRGSEDLGSGISAVFVLENGFSVTNGRLLQGGDEFGRQAYVGLSSSRIGTLMLGRQYDLNVDYVAKFAAVAQWGTTYSAHPGDLDNFNNTNRVNNAIKFKSLDYSGFTFGALYSFGGNAGDFSRNQIWSVGANYQNGPFALAAAYVDVNDPNYSFFGNNASSSTNASNMTGSRVYSGYASAKSQRIASAGGALTLGATTVGAVYSNTVFSSIGTDARLPAVGRGGSARFNNFEVNVKHQVTPALLIGAAYDFTDGYGVNDAKYNQVSLGIDYFLSKRTDLYLTGVYQHASGRDSTGTQARANINGVSASSTSNQVLAVAGIRHKF
ncbi:putative porin [Paraburkholderia caledonica]|uniref:Porin n=1 Tax=Paraburkholderia caledonica TaxID=134536 RepID=A0AB73ILA3_9BURK|nr:putative porin [Paraburkholderia caledonica]